MQETTAFTFDERATLDALGDDRQLLAIVAKAFIDDSPKLLQRLHSATLSGDAREVQSAGHALKGAVRFFGESPIYDLAYSLETQGRSGNLERAGAAIAQLEVCVPRLATELQRLLERSSLERSPSAADVSPGI
jgi:HPt (histidine-containing phosphotransfer) domain-containing protein